MPVIRFILFCFFFVGFSIIVKTMKLINVAYLLANMGNV